MKKILLKLIFIATIVFCFSHVTVRTLAIDQDLYPINPIRISASVFDTNSNFNVTYWLEEGKVYHIFIVGDWVESNESKTDYDVTYFDVLSDQQRSHTEAPALPEQIWNDGKGMYYLSDYTGYHTFTILHDVEDGDEDGERDAVIMAIEHIEVDKIYTKFFKGRSIPGAEYDYNTFYNPWAWEFSTNANEFEVYVDVPDSLDMFELRLFPMAQPTSGIGYDLSGVGTPSGKLLNSSTSGGLFGGYVTSRNESQSNLIASCEYLGEDMRIHFKNPDINELNNDSKPTFYYLVLIAEYFQGEVNFWIKTDYTEPRLTEVNNVSICISDSPTEITVSVDSNQEIKEAYIEHSIDNWETKNVTPIRLQNNDYYVGTIPAYGLNTTVDYLVTIQDTFNNIGSLKGKYIVLDPVFTSLDVSRRNSVGGQTIQITGVSSVSNANIKLSVVHSEFTKTFNIMTNANGEFIFDYTPPQDGLYNASFSFEGDGAHIPATSPSKSFTVSKLELTIYSYLDNSEYKINQLGIIQGGVTPPIEGILIDLSIVSPSTYRVENLVTSSDGTFEATLILNELGTWEILPQINNSDLFATISNEIVMFNVVKLSDAEKMAWLLQSMTQLPLVLIPIGLIVAIVVIVAVKRDSIRNLLKKQNTEESKKEETDPDAPSSYRRKRSN